MGHIILTSAEIKKTIHPLTEGAEKASYLLNWLFHPLTARMQQPSNTANWLFHKLIVEMHGLLHSKLPTPATQAEMLWPDYMAN